jgi:hypothetical protein
LKLKIKWTWALWAWAGVTLFTVGEFSRSVMYGTEFTTKMFIAILLTQVVLLFLVYDAAKDEGVKT